jgi:hypothetical protein
MNTLSLITLFTLTVLASATPYVRFVNTIEGVTVTIKSNRLADISLNYQSVTNYNAIPEGSISVSSISDSNGNQLTSVSILINFNFFATVAVVKYEGRTVLVLFNETMPAANDNNGNRAWIRMMNFNSAINYISIDSNSAALFSYVGYLEVTPFVAINAASTSSLIGSQSGNGAVSFPVDIGSGFIANNAYTIMVFSPASGNIGKVVYDHAVASSSSSSASTSGDVLPTEPSTSAESSTSTSSDPVPSSSSSTTDSTDSVPSSTSSTSSVNPPHPSTGAAENADNATSKVQVIGFVSIVLALLAL